MGCPIRRSPDQSLLAAPRGISQRATSFIASSCQGLHQTPLSCLRDHPRAGTGPKHVNALFRLRQTSASRQHHPIPPETRNLFTMKNSKNQQTNKPRRWWSRSGSNRRPVACKATALPTELRPRQRTEARGQNADPLRWPATRSRRRRVVGLGGLEPPTSRLSGVRSNQLSYRPPVRGQRSEDR